MRHGQGGVRGRTASTRARYLRAAQLAGTIAASAAAERCSWGRRLERPVAVTSAAFRSHRVRRGRARGRATGPFLDEPVGTITSNNW